MHFRLFCRKYLSIRQGLDAHAALFVAIAVAVVVRLLDSQCKTDCAVCAGHICDSISWGRNDVTSYADAGQRRAVDLGLARIAGGPPDRWLFTLLRQNQKPTENQK